MLGRSRSIEFAIAIIGHTDGLGDDDYNLALSQRRAEAVKSYLVSTYNVDPSRLVTVGRGESELLDAANPESPINRRVEFHRTE